MEKPVYIVEAFTSADGSTREYVGVVDAPASESTIKLMAAKISTIVHKSMDVPENTNVAEDVKKLFESMDAMEDEIGFNLYASLTRVMYTTSDIETAVSSKDILLYSGNYKSSRYKDEVMKDPFLRSNNPLKIREAVLICEHKRKIFMNAVKEKYSGGYVIVNGDACRKSLYEYINFMMIVNPLSEFYVTTDGNIKTNSGTVITYVNPDGEPVKFPTTVKELRGLFPNSEND